MEILAEEYRVIGFDFETDSKAGIPFRFIAQKLFLLKNILRADLIICEFAAYHSLLPALFGKLFGKPCLIISGGTDAHYFPGIGYGNWQKKIVKTFTSLSFKLCSHIAPKHKSLMQFEYSYDSQEPSAQGIYARVPNLKTPFTEITNGYDSVKWHCTKEKRKNTFITVCSGWEFSFQYQLKGIDLMVDVAASFPDCEFIVLGVPGEKLIQKKSSNVKILPPVKNEELIGILSECEFYMQLSMAEGFPNSLCEAMLCECVPIGSNVFSITEIIGDSGFVLQHRNVEELRKLIGESLVADKNTLRGKARKRIADNYTLESRREKLLKLCDSLLKN